MRVLFVNHAGGSPYHGPNMRTYYLARAMVQEGHSVQIVASSFFHKYFSPPDTTGRVTHEWIDGIHYTWVRTHPYRHRGLREVLNQLEFVARCTMSERKIVVGHPDVVVASSPHPFVSFFAWRAAKHSRAGFVFEARDLWPLVVRELGGLPAWHPYIVLLTLAERFSVHRADLIVSIDEGGFRYFGGELGVTSDRFAVVPNGLSVDCWFLEPLPSELLERWPKASFTVGYLGATSAAYSLRNLIDAAAEVCASDPDVAFVIAGSGSELQSLKAHARRIGAENVVFLGQVHRRHVPAVLARFDVGYLGLKDVRAYRYGVSPSKLFEYFYAGIPVLAAYRTYHDTVADAGAGWTIAPEDSRTLARTICEIRETPKAQLAAIGARGRDFFLNHHESHVRARQYIQLMESIDKTRGIRLKKPGPFGSEHQFPTLGGL
jgi:glycosyltransferase involved in cell wall biosynthesis